MSVVDDAESGSEDGASPGSSTLRWIGRVGGPVLAVCLYWLPELLAVEMQPAARATAAIGAWMAVWWMTEAFAAGDHVAAAADLVSAGADGSIRRTDAA